MHIHIFPLHKFQVILFKYNPPNNSWSTADYFSKNFFFQSLFFHPFSYEEIRMHSSSIKTFFQNEVNQYHLVSIFPIIIGNKDTHCPLFDLVLGGVGSFSFLECILKCIPINIVMYLTNYLYLICNG